MNPQLLFVYGTLRGDLSHELSNVLSRSADYLGEATARGRLYSLGAYPGMVLSDREDDSVKGELYQVWPERWEKVIGELDSYEGCGPDDPEPHDYDRALVDVTTASGKKARAWAYLLALPTTNLVAIPSGDYRTWQVSAEGSRR